VEFEIKLYVIGAPRKTVQNLNPQLKLTVQSHQSCIYVCQLTVQRHQSGIYVCQLTVQRHQSCTYVCQLTVQRHQSCTYVCQLTVQRHQSCIYVCQQTVQRHQIFMSVRWKFYGALCSQTSAIYIQYTDSIDRVHMRCIQYDCKRYVVYV
jgi:sucrose-6-phosphate hydrolase SacC (GH32 family)